MGKKGRVITVVAIFVFASLFLFISIGMTEAQKLKIAPPCKQCHQPDEKILRGAFSGVSKKAGTIQMQIGPATWLVKWDDNTELIGAEGFSKIPKDKEIAIAIEEKGGVLYAKSLSVKPPAKIPAEKLMKVEELAKLLEMGTEKGNFSLVDSRPAQRYNEGFIPGAINIYDAEFDKNIEKLPKEKDRLLIFYCGGVT